MILKIRGGGGSYGYIRNLTTKQKIEDASIFYGMSIVKNDKIYEKVASQLKM